MTDISYRYKRNIYGVGFIGVGKYKLNTRIAAVWRSMLERCYSEEYVFENLSYLNCIVCDKWHNFQNFAEWYESNNVKGYHLDKDLKFPGFKIYSEDNCVFIPAKINCFFYYNVNKKELPHGVSKCNKKFKQSSVSFSKTVNTIKEAVDNYWNWKLEKTNSLCKKYPEFKELILNYFEYYFNLLYPEYVKNKIIVDLEGCLSNAKHRMHLLEEHKFLKFQNQFKNDSLNENVNMFIKQFKEFRESEIVILTAKREEYREIVVDWLKKYNVIYDKLIMKNEDILDVDFKNRYARVHKEEIMFALDDTGKIAQMFSDNGIPCLRVEQNGR